MRAIFIILVIIGAGVVAGTAYVMGIGPRPAPAQIAHALPAAEPIRTRVAFPISNAIGKSDRMARDLSLPFVQTPAFEPLGNQIPRGVADTALTVLLVPPQWRQALAHAEKPTNILLNEAQIASIRERLQLSPDQQKLWPGAEDALRQLVTRLYRARKSRNVNLPDDNEIADIKAKAAPFIASLTTRQRNDIRVLAGVAGLDTAMLGM